MVTWVHLVLFVIAAATVSGCGLFPPVESWLKAEIMHAEDTDSFFGDGFFTLSSRDGSVTPTFTISAADRGSIGSTFLLVIASDSRPAVGSYPVVPMTEPLSPAGFSGLYLEDLPGGARMFAAEEGHVEIVRSTRTLVEGTFSLRAVLYCRVSDDPTVTEGPCTPTQAPVGNEQVERRVAQGSFSLVKGGNKAMFASRRAGA